MGGGLSKFSLKKSHVYSLSFQTCLIFFCETQNVMLTEACGRLFILPSAKLEIWRASPLVLYDLMVLRCFCLSFLGIGSINHSPLAFCGKEKLRRSASNSPLGFMEE